jgi:anaerobic selenocysteine-containing dehydrogenase
MHWLTDKDPDGGYRIPRIIYADAYSSEMVAYADLVLPDTTYLERHDAISMLDRPISEADCAADAIRHPVLPLGADATCAASSRCCSSWARASGLPALLREDGSPRYRDYADYIVNHERAPGVGLLAGWRGRRWRARARARPIRRSSSATSPTAASGARSAGVRALFQDGQPRLPAMVGEARLHRLPAPVVLQLYSETLQKFRLAAQGPRPGAAAGARA